MRTRAGVLFRPTRHRRSRALLALALAFVILAGLSGGTVLTYASLRNEAGRLQAQLTSQLEAGQAELQGAKVSLQQANAAHDYKLVDKAKVQFVAAKVHFMLANQIADSSQLLGRLEGVPEVGNLARARHTAVNGIAGMGVAISDAGLDIADLDGQLIKPPGSDSHGARTLLTVLDQVQASLVKVRTALKGAQTAAATVDISVLPGGQQAAFVKARGTIASALASSDEFDQLVPILKEVLGGNGSRTYLIEQVNPAELRPGGGFIGTYSVLRADHGTLSLVRSGNATDFIYPRYSVGEAGYIEPPGPIKELIPNTSWSFIDSNFFPDFPSNAKSAQNFVQPRIGTIDAVISMDYYTVAKMLELTGPLQVPGYQLIVDATNFITTVVKYDLVAASDPAADKLHKAILSALAGPLMQRLSTLPPAQWPALISALNDLAASRHLQVYFNNAAVEQQMDKFGWTGVLKTTRAKDFMMEVESNLGGTKANYFVTRKYSVGLTRIGAALHHTVSVDILDDMPYAYAPNEFYRAYIRLYVGGKAVSPSNDMSRPRYRNPAPPAGTQMSDGWISFHGYGHHRVVEFVYDTPWEGGGRGQQQIYWQKQPGTLNDAIEVTWNDGNGHTSKVTGDLSQDRLITLGPGRVTLIPGQPGQAALPSLGLG